MLARSAARLNDVSVSPAPASTAGLVGRLRPMVAELLKFVVVGGFCFVLDLGLFNLLHFGLELGPLTAKTVSTVVATAVSYVGNRLWSFAHRVSDSGAQRRDLTVYAAINVVGLVITLMPVGVTHYLLDLTGQVELNVAAVVGTAFATVFRFLAYRRWVFVGDPDAAEREALV